MFTGKKIILMHYKYKWIYEQYVIFHTFKKIKMLFVSL